MVTLNKPMPAFSCLTTGNTLLESKDLQGKQVVFYFYPKDCTPGCTQEGQDFRDHFAEFSQLNTLIYGVSRDTLTLHEKFKKDQQFPFELIADKDQQLCELFNVIQEKSMYGKKVLGIERSTFLFDKHGVLRYEWRKVKVPQHVTEVLAAATQLTTA